MYCRCRILSNRRFRRINARPSNPYACIKVRLCTESHDHEPGVVLLLINTYSQIHIIISHNTECVRICVTVECIEHLDAEYAPSLYNTPSWCALKFKHHTIYTYKNNIANKHLDNIILIKYINANVSYTYYTAVLYFERTILLYYIRTVFWCVRGVFSDGMNRKE